MWEIVSGLCEFAILGFKMGIGSGRYWTTRFQSPVVNAVRRMLRRVKGKALDRL